MRLHRFVVAISLFLLLAASCGGGGTEEATPTPTCTTVTPGPDGSPTPTPTPCLVGATGAPPTAEPTGFTGEVWEGTYRGVVGVEGCQTEFEGTFGIAVDADGIATMEGIGTTGGICAGQNVPPFTSDFVAIGERTSSGFRFTDATPYGPGQISFTIAVTGDEGTGHFQGPTYGGGATATVDFEVTCLTCGVPGG